MIDEIISFVLGILSVLIPYRILRPWDEKVREQ